MVVDDDRIAAEGVVPNQARVERNRVALNARDDAVAHVPAGPLIVANADFIAHAQVGDGLHSQGPVIGFGVLREPVDDLLAAREQRVFALPSDVDVIPHDNWCSRHVRARPQNDLPAGLGERVDGVLNAARRRIRIVEVAGQHERPFRGRLGYGGYDES